MRGKRVKGRFARLRNRLEVIITLSTGRSSVTTGLRRVLFGLAAAAITFSVGRLFSILFGV